MPPPQRTPQGPPPAPGVQRLRVRYARRGRMRFTSVRDFQRVLERALRRAEIPVAFSAGFHPHPKISYANAAATGTASEAEYFDIHLSRRLAPADFAARLDAALPEGMDIVAAVEPPPGGLAELLVASRWRVEFRDTPRSVLDAAVCQLLASPGHTINRMTKSGPRDIDVRAALVAAVLADPDEGRALGGEAMAYRPADGTGQDVTSHCEILHLVVRHTTPAVRPDDVITALRDLSPDGESAAGGASPDLLRPALIVRLAQGPLDARTGEVTDPLATGPALGPDLLVDDIDGMRDDAAHEREPDRM